MIKLMLSYIFLLTGITNNPDQLYETALIYETGNDSIAPDPNKSTIFYRLAAEKGNVEAQNYLGFRYYNGEGTKQNVDSALYWIRKAAGQGDIKAAGNLGYLLSKAPEINHDYEEALKWLKIAAEAGLPTSFTQLGDLYRHGLGTPRDTLNAIKWYDKAIDSRIPDTEIRLLSMMGYKWKELSPDSALVLGLKYYMGNAPTIGVELFENATKGTLPKAVALLGDAYAKGRGVPYDNKKSIEHYLEAAILGDPSAAFIIAEFLEFFPDGLPEMESLSQENKGKVSKEDLNSPQFWYNVASSQGIIDSESAFRHLYSPSF